MGRRRRIDGARMLVTGASQGIGRALVVEAARRGVRVLAVARSEALIDELVKEVRSSAGTVEPVVADVTSPTDRQTMVDAAQAHFGGLDLLVNNAGIGATGHFAEAGPERLRQIMEVNFFGLTETTRAFLPLLKQGKDPAVINISSIAGKRALPARSEYSASKFAVQGFSEAIRSELAKDGVDVLIVCPGLTSTNFSKNMIEQKARVGYDHLRGMTSERVAAATLRAIERGQNEIHLTFGGRMVVLINRFLPRLVDRIAAKRVRAVFADELSRKVN